MSERLRQDREACNKSVNEVIDRFTVAGLVTWPLNGSKSGADLVLIQTFDTDYFYCAINFLC